MPFLLIDKPPKLTSHDVVARLRRITRIKRIGHAGTLDPFATGLLLVGIEREATREMQRLVGLDKVYVSTVSLGARSTTDDVEGELTQVATKEEIDALTPERIAAALVPFHGPIAQVPPSYAAIKIEGKKLYELARAGTPTLVEPRHITVFSLDLLDAQADPSEASAPRYDVSLRLHVSSGTYIRAIARDLGNALHLGGFAKTLRRTDIGPFSVTHAVSLEELTPENWHTKTIETADILAKL